MLQAPSAATRAQLDELVAATRLPYVERVVLKIQGLYLDQIPVHRRACAADSAVRYGGPVSEEPADHPGARLGLTPTAQIRAGLQPYIHPLSAEIIPEMISIIREAITSDPTTRGP